MPVISRTFLLNASPKSALTVQLNRHHLSTFPRLLESKFHRSDFGSQSWTGSYEAGRPTEGPLSEAPIVGASRLTPSLLKEHLDKFVVGQDKAKKVTSVAIYNHYQRIREIRRREAEEEEKERQRERRETAERERRSHPVENEYPGHVQTVDLNATRRVYTPEPELGSKPLDDSASTVIEKSNLLLLGPSGVGKTYILQTLARVLEVPFATVDCSSLTQAGYIGTDIESSIERLLLASSHSITKCETGIIFFDEVDKLAKPPVMTHGRDVSGEGVQQGLLKMIEGTTVTVNAKADRNSKTKSEGKENAPTAGGKNEQYTIDTSNILFVFAGAFVGLEKIISKRLSSGTSIGFGAELKSKPPPSSLDKEKPPASNLHQVSPTDLQSYGLIPELLGRIPITVALSPLSLTQLVSILTEPKNSLVKQYTALFNTFRINLRFTTPALHAIAERALGSNLEKGEREVGTGGIGARGLRSILEGILQEIMFWGPGSSIRYCLIDEAFVRSHTPTEGENEESTKMPRCWGRGQGRAFEEAWEVEERGEMVDEEAGSFERLRSVGSSGM